MALYFGRYRRFERAHLTLLALLILSGALMVPLTSANADSREPASAAELLKVATTFNEDYAANRPGLVYDRWDAPSRAVISRVQYVRRHLECPTPPGPATIEGAQRVGGNFWTVRYEIGGVQLTDYWHYVTGRWRFNLAKSNPGAVSLYRMNFLAYARAVGCVPGSS